MRSKKIIIIYAIVLFAIVFVIAFNSVCSITQMDVRFEVSSTYAKEKAVQLQKEMDGYLKKNYLFFKTETVEKIFQKDENAHFKLISVEKKFPNKVVVKIKEMYESYAFYNASDKNYVITDSNGEIIILKSDVTNNLGGTNIEIKGFDLNAVTLRKTVSVAENQTKAFSGVKSALLFFDNELGGVRTNISSVDYDELKGTATFKTQEGVLFYFTDISKYSNELFKAVCDKYSSLSDNNKICGRIIATVKDNGELNVGYTEKESV